MIDNSDLYPIRCWDTENIFDMDASEPTIINSSSSSDCGDDFGLASGRVFSLTDADYSELPIAQILDCSLSDWVNEVTCPGTTGEPATVANKSSLPRRKTKRHYTKSLHPFEVNKWSKLSFYEQNDVIDELTEIISTQLDLPQQLDIIRIIDPHAVISSTDKQFAIDVNTLTDNKWKALIDQILKSTNIKAKSNRNCRSRKVKRQPGKKNTRKKQNKAQEDIEMQSDESDKTKRKTQLEKEYLSGLFVKEEILSLTSSQLTEEDVDILD